MYLEWTNDCQHYRTDQSCMHAQKDPALGPQQALQCLGEE